MRVSRFRNLHDTLAITNDWRNRRIARINRIIAPAVALTFCKLLSSDQASHFLAYKRTVARASDPSFSYRLLAEVTMTTEVLNMTTAAAVESAADFYSKFNTPAAGWVAIIICSVCFGTNLIPVKKFDMGDGAAFQWLMCTGILLVGIIVQLIVGSLYRVPQFYPLAMVGGALWATGNSLTVIIIEAIGLSLGILIWSIANMLFGFTTSRFGVFGIPPKIPSKPSMNYVGVAIAVVSVALYAAIKPSEDDRAKDAESGAVESNEAPQHQRQGKCCGLGLVPISQMPSGVRRALGIILAVIAGSFYGNTFVPTIYIQKCVEGASQAGLDYVFANFVGIWLASTVIFIIYGLGKRNKPWLPAKEAILPALSSGVLWGLAQSAWFIANAALGEPITFPVVTTCPAVIATLVGVLVFREIRGKRNYIILSVAICVTITGVIINALSL
uniref:Transmembrane protein 144 n=1 Tax=Mesocestoides corti TaxID=53468 RepID=A0A5K3F4K5_MESCO